MDLTTLFEGVSFEGTLPAARQPVSLVTQDSRRVTPGAVFVCAKGRQTDGHDYAKKALEMGACCIVTERPLGLPCEVRVENARKAYALLCQNFFGRPAQRLRLIAVTGTNGKTTVTTLIQQALQQMGHRVGLIGTIHTMIDTMEVPAKYTTPEAWDMAALLSRMEAAGCDFAVMEASSQALDQMRLWGLTFEVGVFTNLTQDHLDYHGDFEHYYQAKKSLFEQTRCAVINLDDEYGVRLAKELDGRQPVMSFGIKAQPVDVTAKEIELSAGGARFLLAKGNEEEPLFFPMPGAYSVDNALAAAAVLSTIGASWKEIARVLHATRGVRGRCEVLYAGEFTVLCDFAHTGDAVEKVLSAIAPFVKGRLIALFGCAGERDAKKRPAMAHAASRYADFAVLTSDNPRKEDPFAILNSVEADLKQGGKPYLVEVERRTAVRKALSMLKKDDVLVLCGKGHEDYQVIDGVTIYLDEHRIVKEWLQEKGLL